MEVMDSPYKIVINMITQGMTGRKCMEKEEVKNNIGTLQYQEVVYREQTGYTSIGWVDLPIQWSRALSSQKLPR